LLDVRFPGRPAYDTAVSRALLTRVAAGAAPETLRLYVPEDVVAFSVLDRVRPGFAEALRVAREQGFEAMLRLAGGRAAVFTTQSLAFAWCIPAAEARRDIAARFDRLARIVREALSSIGVDARIGAVPGEYCPGEHSVNARGERKLMGVGQRIVKGAAHVGGVIVVRQPERVARVLEPIYAAMELPLDNAATGAVDQELPGVGLAEVRDALLRRFAREAEIHRTEPDAELLALAETVECEHQL
jgi:lipoate-protein ligase A